MKDRTVKRTFFEDGKLWPSYELENGDIIRLRGTEDGFAYYTDFDWAKKQCTYEEKPKKWWQIWDQ